MVFKISIRATMAQMTVGQTILVPVEMCAYATVRSYASVLGASMDRRYGVHRGKKATEYEITRYE